MGWHVPWRVGQELLEHGNEQQCTLVVLSSPVTVCAYNYMYILSIMYVAIQPLNLLTFRCGIWGLPIRVQLACAHGYMSKLCLRHVINVPFIPVIYA